MAITDGIDPELYAAWKARHPEWAHHDVIEATETGIRHGMYETPSGRHYEADEPKDWADTEIMHRVERQTEIVVIGYFPNEGMIEEQTTSDSPPRTRIRSTVTGAWVKR